MDKLKIYQNILTELLEEYQKYLAKAKIGYYDNTVKHIIDLKNNHFQLLIVGWKDGKFNFSPLFHFDIIDDKVWLQQNNTEFLLTDELMDKGIKKEDIVLGFLNERERAYSNFAVA